MYLKRFSVRTDDQVLFVDPADVYWIEPDANYVVLHTETERYRVRGPLRELEQALEPTDFVRIHRGAIVNTACLRRLELGDAGDCVAVLSNEARVPCSREGRKALLAFFHGSPVAGGRLSRRQVSPS